MLAFAYKNATIRESGTCTTISLYTVLINIFGYYDYLLDVVTLLGFIYGE